MPKNLEQARKIAKEHNAISIVHCAPVFGLDVWRMEFGRDDETLRTGWPEYIIFSAGEAKLSDPDIAEQYMNYVNLLYDRDEDDNIIGFDEIEYRVDPV